MISQFEESRYGPRSSITDYSKILHKGSSLFQTPIEFFSVEWETRYQKVACPSGNLRCGPFISGLASSTLRIRMDPTAQFMQQTGVKDANQASSMLAAADGDVDVRLFSLLHSKNHFGRLCWSMSLNEPILHEKQTNMYYYLWNPAI